MDPNESDIAPITTDHVSRLKNKNKCEKCPYH